LPFGHEAILGIGQIDCRNSTQSADSTKNPGNSPASRRAVTVMHPLPSLPGYDLLREIGGGSLTRIFHARHQTGGFDCAVKLLRPEWEQDDIAQQVIAREARVGLAVRHRHIIKMLNAHVDACPHFLVMNLLPVQTLRDRLRCSAPLEKEVAWRIVGQIAAAVQALHQAGFAHCDIKPDNIGLIDENWAVLMDLGFSHRPGEQIALIRRGYLFGTPDYLAPELCRFDADHTFASDWFSFGLTLLEILTGDLPYQKGDIETVLAGHETMDIRFWVKYRTKLWPRRLAQLIEALVSFNPGDRPKGRVIVEELRSIEEPQRLILKVA
jgi:serine/threonine protein kinase